MPTPPRTPRPPHGTSPSASPRLPLSPPDVRIRTPPRAPPPTDFAELQEALQEQMRLAAAALRAASPTPTATERAPGSPRPVHSNALADTRYSSSHNTSTVSERPAHSTGDSPAQPLSPSSLARTPPLLPLVPTQPVPVKEASPIGALLSSPATSPRAKSPTSPPPPPPLPLPDDAIGIRPFPVPLALPLQPLPAGTHIAEVAHEPYEAGVPNAQPVEMPLSGLLSTPPAVTIRAGYSPAGPPAHVPPPDQPVCPTSLFLPRPPFPSNPPPPPRRAELRLVAANHVTQHSTSISSPPSPHAVPKIPTVEEVAARFRAALADSQQRAREAECREQMQARSSPFPLSRSNPHTLLGTGCCGLLECRRWHLLHSSNIVLIPAMPLSPRAFPHAVFSRALDRLLAGSLPRPPIHCLARRRRTCDLRSGVSGCAASWLTTSASCESRQNATRPASAHSEWSVPRATLCQEERRVARFG